MRLEDKGVMTPHVTGNHVEIDRSGAGGTVVAALVIDVVQVKANEAGRTGGEVAFVIEKPFDLLDAGMAGVVPIAEGRLVGKVCEEVVETVVERQFEDPLAVFDSEDEIVRDDGGKKLVVGGEDAFERSPGAAA